LERDHHVSDHFNNGSADGRAYRIRHQQTQESIVLLQGIHVEIFIFVEFAGVGQRDIVDSGLDELIDEGVLVEGGVAGLDPVNYEHLTG
jgi:hypothetical protein